MGVASVSGSVSVGDTNSPDLTVTVSGTTGSFNEHFRGRQVIPANTTDATIDFGAVTTASFFYLKATDASSGAEKTVVLNLNAVGNLPASSTFLHMAAENSALTSVTADSQNDGTDTVVEYVVAGD